MKLFAFQENKSKVVRGTVLTLKRGPNFKKILRNAGIQFICVCWVQLETPFLTGIEL